MLAYEFENKMDDRVFDSRVKCATFHFVMERHLEDIFAGNATCLEKVMRRRKTDKITITVCGVKKELVRARILMT